MSDSRPDVIKTWLNGKPAPNSIVVVLGMLLLMTMVSQVYWKDLWGVAEFLPAIPERVFEKGEWWRIYTAVFIHADFKHFLSNMYMLSIFGFFVYGYFGKALFPLLSVLIAGPVNAISLLTYQPQVHLLGASGLVYVLAGIWLTLFVFLQRQHSLFGRLIRVTGMSLLILFPSTFEPSVSYRAHFFGFLAGVMISAIYYALSGYKLHAFEIHRPPEIIDEEELPPTFH